MVQIDSKGVLSGESVSEKSERRAIQSLSFRFFGSVKLNLAKRGCTSVSCYESQDLVLNFRCFEVKRSKLFETLEMSSSSLILGNLQPFGVDEQILPSINPKPKASQNPPQESEVGCFSDLQSLQLQAYFAVVRVFSSTFVEKTLGIC